MSRLGRLLPSVAQPRRSYSIFSSSSGNGRYFNSSKPANVVTSTTKPGSSSGSNTSSASAPSEPVDKLTDDVQVPSQEQMGSDVSKPFATTPSPSAKDAPAANASSTRTTVPLTNAPLHSSLKSNDLMLHRFFSLHRPCLLLNQPINALFEAAQAVSTTKAPPSPLGTIDDPPVASSEADSDAARQLSRSLVMNKVGNLVDWEHTLSRLGLAEAKELDAPIFAGVSMDSVKRKRRKKMKKHKYVFFAIVIPHLAHVLLRLKKRRRVCQGKAFTAAILTRSLTADACCATKVRKVGWMLEIDVITPRALGFRRYTILNVYLFCMFILTFPVILFDSLETSMYCISSAAC